LNPDRARAPAFVHGERYPRTDGPWHAHARAQLLHVSEGVITVHTEAGVWVAPPERGVWVPARVRHRVSSRRPFWLRTLYVKPELVRLPAPERCRVIGVDGLVRELLIAATELGADFAPGGPEARLVRVILDRLPSLEVAPLELPEPRDPRIARVARALADDPSDTRTLDALATLAGSSGKTLARLFRAETGFTFGRWRQRLRLLAALEKLGAGKDVTTVALDVGYTDTSAFIAMFKAALGTTPARYFRRER
jgi:AraC-like DNA-binding protein